MWVGVGFGVFWFLDILLGVFWFFFDVLLLVGLDGLFVFGDVGFLFFVEVFLVGWKISFV